MEGHGAPVKKNVFWKGNWGRFFSTTCFFVELYHPTYHWGFPGAHRSHSVSPTLQIRDEKYKYHPVWKVGTSSSDVPDFSG